MLNAFRQRGLSMVELLVALAISSFLILGITQVYIDNKRGYVFQQSQANNQENTRFAEYTLDTWLNKAGYRRTPYQNIEYAYPSIGASGGCNAFIKGAVITGLSTSETGLCIRYQPASAAELDCQGNVVKTIGSDTKLAEPFAEPDQTEVVVMAIKFVPDADLHKGSLQCKNITGTTPAFAELIDGVADMRFEFAEGELIDKKLKSTSPWSASASGIVRAVRYSVLLGSRTNQRDSSDSKVYTDWVAKAVGANKTRIQSGDKLRVYQCASSTQTLRNIMP